MRATPFLSKPSAKQIQQLITAENAKFMIMAQHGPLSFSLQEIPQVDTTTPLELLMELMKRKKMYKVILGAPHSCTCQSGKQDCYCEHIAFLNLKKFKISMKDQLCYQTSWTDLELDRILSGRLNTKPLKKPSRQPSSDQITTQKQTPRCEITPETYCAICLDNIDTEDPATLPFCSCCGNSLHERCLYMYLANARQQKAKETCIYCRAEWKDGRTMIYNEGTAKKQAKGLSNNGDIESCTCCQIKLNKHYAVKSFSNQRFCYPCLAGMENGMYTINKRNLVLKKAPIKPLQNQRAQLLQNFYHRDISTEDYDILLRLDDVKLDQRAVQLKLSTFLVPFLFKENISGQNFECQLCQNAEINPYNLLSTDTISDIENLDLDINKLHDLLKEQEVRLSIQVIENYLNKNVQFFLPCGQHAVHGICALICSVEKAVLRQGEQYFNSKVLTDFCDICKIPYVKEWLRESRLAKVMIKQQPKQDFNVNINVNQTQVQKTITPRRERTPGIDRGNDLMGCLQINNILPVIRK